MGEVLWRGKFHVVYTWEDPLGQRWVVLTSLPERAEAERMGAQLSRVEFGSPHYRFAVYFFLGPDLEMKMTDLMAVDTPAARRVLIEQAMQLDAQEAKRLQEAQAGAQRGVGLGELPGQVAARQGGGQVDRA